MTTTVSSLSCGVGRRLAISGFILFHWACVLAWVWPNPSDLKTFFFNLRMPLPVPGAGHGRMGWRVEFRPVVSTYLFNTAQYQDWAMFAPNPLEFNRFVAATVTFRDGRREEYGFPRLCQLDGLHAWVEKRYRKLQHRIADENVAAFREDLARYIARRVNEGRNPPVRVTLYDYRSPIPKPDRAGLDPREWVDYSKLLREDARFTGILLLDYAVRPEDLQ